MTKKKTTQPRITFYKSYHFDADQKDPIIDSMRTMVHDTGMRFSEIQEASGVTPTTLKNWFEGPTRSPRFATIAAVTRACGYELQVAKPSEGKLHGSDKKPYVPLVHLSGKNGHTKLDFMRPKQIDIMAHVRKLDELDRARAERQKKAAAAG